MNPRLLAGFGLGLPKSIEPRKKTLPTAKSGYLDSKDQTYQETSYPRHCTVLPFFFFLFFLFFSVQSRSGLYHIFDSTKL